jgi:hypothetical protein
MTDRGSGAEGGEDSPILIALHEARLQRMDIPVSFDRKELDQILRLRLVEIDLGLLQVELLLDR